VKRIFILFSCLCTAFVLNAQNGWEAGVWLGTTNYFGDLNTSYDLSRPGISGGIIARYNFNNRVAIKFSGSYGSVSADDSESSNTFEQARNLSFESPIFDATAQFEFNFLPYIHGSKDYFFTPYLFAGLTGFYFNPQAELDGELYELRELGTEGQFKGEEYYSVQGGFAYGGGINLVLFLGCSYLSFWLYKNLNIHNSDSSIGKIFFSGKEWEPIIKSSDLLRQLKEYES
jgi:hypothetical protein